MHTGETGGIYVPTRKCEKGRLMIIQAKLNEEEKVKISGIPDITNAGCVTCNIETKCWVPPKSQYHYLSEI